MVIRKLKSTDAKQFSELIVDMYSHLQNLEWFSPMPYDCEILKDMIESPRFYPIGVFDGDTLCAVSSFDYKCGKLIGVIDFPKECDVNKLVEIGFTMVRSNYQGKGIMKQMVNHLLGVAKEQGFEWVFGKVHVNNKASSTSLIRCGFKSVLKFEKGVKKNEFISLSNEPFFSKVGRENAKVSIKNNENNEKIMVQYEILLKQI